MTKRAYLVVGPESSGNRLMTRLLVAAGCQGEGDHVQRWDTHPPVSEEPIVWLRSVPHARQTPDIVAMVRRLWARGYKVKVVVMLRDWHSTLASQVRMGHVKSKDQGQRHIRDAYVWIFSQVAEASVPFYVVSFEALVARPDATMTWLCDALGLEWRDGMLPEPVLDENAKYYEAAAVPA